MNNNYTDAIRQLPTKDKYMPWCGAYMLVTVAVFTLTYIFSILLLVLQFIKTPPGSHKLLSGVRRPAPETQKTDILALPDSDAAG